VLILALGAVVVGCVFLVVSFLTENIAWAWGCIAACGVAAVVLVVDTIRRGRAPREEVLEGSADAVGPSAAAEPSFAPPVMAREGSVDEPEQAPPAPELPSDAESTQVLTPPHTTHVQNPDLHEQHQPAHGDDTHDDAKPDDAKPDDAEPDEEDVDAADALAVDGLSSEVVVVDEHPRFHLPSCPWVVERATLPLPVREAVELGFTGCARCAPSTTLAAQSRGR